METYLQPARTNAANRQPYVDVVKLRVIIVEDSAIIRARLAESLGEMPNVEIVGQVETEAEALALLKEARWDAAVLDLQLKQGTGLGVLKSLEAQITLGFGETVQRLRET